MGLFDSILKSVRKAFDSAEDTQDRENEEYPYTSAETEQTATSPAVDYVADIIAMNSPVGVPSRKCTYTYFDGDDDADYEIEASVSIDSRFHEYDSGSGEIDASYIYSPDITDDNGYADFRLDTPYILAGFEQAHYNVVRDFREGKGLQSGTTLQTVTGNSRILFKTTLTRYDEKSVAYHFIRGCAGEELLYHIAACYPKKIEGTPLEQIVLDAVDLMASTYAETVIDSIPSAR